MTEHAPSRAWHGRGLTVDLTSGRVGEQPLSAETAHACLGGRGLGAHLLLERGTYAVEPFDPANPLIFATGPLTGTGAPAAGRYSVSARSPLTGTVFDGNSGGAFGVVFKRLGYDYLLVEGALTAPGYVLIGRGGVELREAGDLWGRDVPATLAALRERHPDSEAAVIGPAGENRRPVRLDRQQPRPLDRTRRTRRRHGRQEPEGDRRPGRRRAAPVACRRGALRVRRLRGDEASQGQSDHLAGAARVRHVGAGQRARSGGRVPDAQLPRVALRARRGDLRRGADARATRRSAAPAAAVRSAARGAPRRAARAARGPSTRRSGRSAPTAASAT